MKEKNNIIKDLIHINTMYNSGKNRYYPTLDNIVFLITQIIEAKTTTEYVRFNPFYVNAKLNRQIEFDDYMFYIECREHFTEEELINHLSECVGKNYNKMSEEEIRRARILYPLCKFSDVEKYRELLLSFTAYLNELIPILFNKAKTEMNLSLGDVAFGYFCFEVHSN